MWGWGPAGPGRIRVFEVDHPASQQWKRGRLAAAGIAVPDHVRFVPRLWLLRRRRRSRIFQNLRVPEIVDAVLKEAGISTRWQLVREYPAREYATTSCPLL